MWDYKDINEKCGVAETKPEGGGKKRKERAEDLNHDAELASKRSKGNAQAPFQQHQRVVPVQRKKPGRPRKQPMSKSDTRGTEQVCRRYCCWRLTLQICCLLHSRCFWVQRLLLRCLTV